MFTIVFLKTSLNIEYLVFSRYAFYVTWIEFTLYASEHSRFTLFEKKFSGLDNQTKV